MGEMDKVKAESSKCFKVSTKPQPAFHTAARGGGGWGSTTCPYVDY